MNIRRKISRAYSGKPSAQDDPQAVPRQEEEQKPRVRAVDWQQLSQQTPLSSAAPPVPMAPEPPKQTSAPKAADGAPTPPGLLKTSRDDAGVKRAAKFLLLLGKDEAAKIMRHLSEDELFAVSSAMASIKQVSRMESEVILKEFGFLKVPPHSSSGGVDVAKSLLTSAFGTEKAATVLKKVFPFGAEKPFAFLNDYEAHQISTLLKKEPSRVIAIILRFLEARKSSAVLQSLPASQKVEVMRRLGHLDRLDAEALEKMQSVLREKIRAQGRLVTQEIDGASTMAAILKHMSLDHEERLLKSIDDMNPELGLEIKNQVYTLDLIQNLSDKDLQDVLRTHPDEDIARMLKGRDMRVREKVLHNISSRRREIVEQEILTLGAIPRKEADEAAKEFLDYLMKLADQGTIQFLDRDEIL